MQGKLIVIEGGDSSGKKTQAELLRRWLESQGIVVKYMDFPQYNSVFGKLVGAYLRGEFGSKEELPVEIPSLLYSLDRYQFKQQIVSDIEQGIWYVLDRYYQSNWAYQSAKFKDPIEKGKVLRWLECLDMRMPQADLTFYLHVPVEFSEKLMETRREKQKGIKKDIHEQDTEYLKRVEEQYLYLAQIHNWTIIDCVKNNKLLPVGAIQELIQANVKAKLLG